MSRWLKTSVFSIISFTFGLLHYVLFPSIANAQTIDLRDYIADPSFPEHSLSTGEVLRYTGEGGSGPPGTSPVRQYKNDNWEQFFISGSGIYRREDTSWRPGGATHSSGDATCENGNKAIYTLDTSGKSCNSYSEGDVITSGGARWLPAAVDLGSTYNQENHTIVPIDAGVAPGTYSGYPISNTNDLRYCEIDAPPNYPACNQSPSLTITGYKAPGEYTFCSGVTNPAPVVMISGSAGPGSEDGFVYMEGCGLVGFEDTVIRTGIVDGCGIDTSQVEPGTPDCSTSYTPCVNCGDPPPTQSCNLNITPFTVEVSISGKITSPEKRLIDTGVCSSAQREQELAGPGGYGSSCVGEVSNLPIYGAVVTAFHGKRFTDRLCLQPEHPSGQTEGHITNVVRRPGTDEVAAVSTSSDGTFELTTWYTEESYKGFNFLVFSCNGEPRDIYWCDISRGDIINLDISLPECDGEVSAEGFVNIPDDEVTGVVTGDPGDPGLLAYALRDVEDHLSCRIDPVGNPDFHAPLIQDDFKTWIGLEDIDDSYLGSDIFDVDNPTPDSPLCEPDGSDPTQCLPQSESVETPQHLEGIGEVRDQGITVDDITAFGFGAGVNNPSYIKESQRDAVEYPSCESLAEAFTDIYSEPTSTSGRNSYLSTSFGMNLMPPGAWEFRYYGGDPYDPTIPPGTYSQINADEEVCVDTNGNIVRFGEIQPPWEAQPGSFYKLTNRPLNKVASAGPVGEVLQSYRLSWEFFPYTLLSVPWTSNRTSNYKIDSETFDPEGINNDSYDQDLGQFRIRPVEFHRDPTLGVPEEASNTWGERPYRTYIHFESSGGVHGENASLVETCLSSTTSPDECWGNDPKAGGPAVGLIDTPYTITGTGKNEDGEFVNDPGVISRQGNTACYRIGYPVYSLCACAHSEHAAGNDCSAIERTYNRMNPDDIIYDGSNFVIRNGGDWWYEQGFRYEGGPITRRFFENDIVNTSLVRLIGFLIQSWFGVHKENILLGATCAQFQPGPWVPDPNGNPVSNPYCPASGTVPNPIGSTPPNYKCEGRCNPLPGSGVSSCSYPQDCVPSIAESCEIRVYDQTPEDYGVGDEGNSECLGDVATIAKHYIRAKSPDFGREVQFGLRDFILHIAPPAFIGAGPIDVSGANFAKGTRLYTIDYSFDQIDEPNTGYGVPITLASPEGSQQHVDYARRLVGDYRNATYYPPRPVNPGTGTTLPPGGDPPPPSGSTCNEFNCFGSDVDTFEKQLSCAVGALTAGGDDTWFVVDRYGPWCDTGGIGLPFGYNLMQFYDAYAFGSAQRSCNQMPGRGTPASVTGPSCDTSGVLANNPDPQLRNFCSTYPQGTPEREPGYCPFDFYREALVNCPIPQNNNWPSGITAQQVYDDACTGAGYSYSGYGNLATARNCDGGLSGSRVGQVIQAAQAGNVNPWLLLGVWATESWWGLTPICTP